jgi:hypothetical protein
MSSVSFKWFAMLVLSYCTTFGFIVSKAIANESTDMGPILLWGDRTVHVGDNASRKVVPAKEILAERVTNLIALTGKGRSITLVGRSKDVPSREPNALDVLSLSLDSGKLERLTTKAGLVYAEVSPHEKSLRP